MSNIGRTWAWLAAACMIAACDGTGDATAPELQSARPGGGGGGGETVWGNNLSVPVIFASGVGVTGTVIDMTDVTTTGLRPNNTQIQYAPEYGELPWDRLTLATTGGYYCQNTENTWMAQWTNNGEGGADIPANAFWGDNLTNQQWNVSSVIRVETELQPTTPTVLDGFDMPYASGSNKNEIKCTDGSTGPFPPTVFSATARLTIEKLASKDGLPVCTYFDGSTADKFGNDGPGFYGAEVNVSGKVMYGYNWMLNRTLPASCAGQNKAGWWRLTFWVDPTRTANNKSYEGNVVIAGTDTGWTKFEPKVCVGGDNCTVLEVEIRDGKSKKPTNPGGGEGEGE